MSCRIYLIIIPENIFLVRKKWEFSWHNAHPSPKLTDGLKLWIKHYLYLYIIMLKLWCFFELFDLSDAGIPINMIYLIIIWTLNTVSSYLGTSVKIVLATVFCTSTKNVYSILHNHSKILGEGSLSQHQRFWKYNYLFFRRAFLKGCTIVAIIIYSKICFLKKKTYQERRELHFSRSQVFNPPWLLHIGHLKLIIKRIIIIIIITIFNGLIIHI